MRLSLILKNNILWWSMVVIHIPFTGTIRCYLEYADGDPTPRISSEEFPMCEAFYRFKITNVSYVWWTVIHRGADISRLRSNRTSAYCEVLHSPTERVGDENRREIIAKMEEGFISCYCNTSIICTTRYSTFADYIKSSSREERRVYPPSSNILEKNNQTIRARQELLDKYLASTGMTTTTTTTTEATTTTTEITAVTEAEPWEEEAATEASEGFPKTVLVLIIGVICVALILLFIASVPFVWKIRKERRRKRLERTWEERVRQAGLEIEKQEKEAKTKIRRRRDSKEVGSKEKSSDGSKEFLGSRESIGSKEKLSKESPNAPIVDPFGDFIAHIGTGNVQQQPLGL
ncbi:hypothetical protein V3C99_016335 [Haemonchus contortus]|uniref:Uncharacterized protein n=1 Tax=Haemonchus contortus TaxID=6289 RepID=A0A7I4YYG6_HAECO